MPIHLRSDFLFGSGRQGQAGRTQAIHGCARRQHQPVTFTKEIDNTTPLFNDFIAHNELLKTVEIYFFGFGIQSGLNAGREALQYKITLRKAFVSKVEFVGRVDIAAQEGNRFPLTEKISLVYESIHWEWMSPKAAADDVFSSSAS